MKFLEIRRCWFCLLRVGGRCVFQSIFFQKKSEKEAHKPIKTFVTRKAGVLRQYPTSLLVSPFRLFLELRCGDSRTGPFPTTSKSRLCLLLVSGVCSRRVRVWCVLSLGRAFLTSPPEAPRSQRRGGRAEAAWAKTMPASGGQRLAPWPSSGSASSSSP